MKMSVAPSVASGRCDSGEVAYTTTPSTTIAAMTLVSCERVPDAVAIAVLGGLASTASVPIRPAAPLPTPIPIRSRLKSLLDDAPTFDARIVAAVWTRCSLPP